MEEYSCEVFRMLHVISNSAIRQLSFFILIVIDGTEGVFSHMMGVSYSMLDSIMIGLSWQWFSLIYKEKTNGIIKEQVVITGSEAVTR